MSDNEIMQDMQELKITLMPVGQDGNHYACAKYVDKDTLLEWDLNCYLRSPLLSSAENDKDSVLMYFDGERSYTLYRKTPLLTDFDGTAKLRAICHSVRRHDLYDHITENDLQCVSEIELKWGEGDNLRAVAPTLIQALKGLVKK